MRFLDKFKSAARRSVPVVRKAAGYAVIAIVFAGFAFAGGVVGGLVSTGHWDADGPELTEFQHNWEATVAVVMPDGRKATGVVVSRSGHVLTCKHVVDAADGQQIRVAVETGNAPKTYDAEVIAVDEGHDLAILSIPRHFPRPAVLELRDVPPYPGDEIYGIGYPVELGNIRAVGRGSTRILRFVPNRPDWTASINDSVVLQGQFESGNSGAGVFLNRNGRLVGLLAMEMRTWLHGSLLENHSHPVIIPVRHIRFFLLRHDVPFNEPDPPWYQGPRRRIEHEVNRLLN